MYHFSSGTIDPNKLIAMSGRVIVRGMKVYFGNVHLKIGGKSFVDEIGVIERLNRIFGAFLFHKVHIGS